MSRLVIRLVAIVATGLTLFGPLSSAPAQAEIWRVPASNPSANPTLDLEEFEVQVMNQINVVRAASGRKKIQHFDTCVDRMAEAWANRIASTGTFEHRDQHQVLRRCDQKWAGENLIRGEQLTPLMTVEAWMASPGHRETLMKKRASLVGVAVVLDASDRFVGVLNFSDPD